MTSVVTDDGNGGRDGCREECRDGRRSRNEKEVRGGGEVRLDLTSDLTS